MRIPSGPAPDGILTFVVNIYPKIICDIETSENPVSREVTPRGKWFAWRCDAPGARHRDPPCPPHDPIKGFPRQNSAHTVRSERCRPWHVWQSGNGAADSFPDLPDLSRLARPFRTLPPGANRCHTFASIGLIALRPKCTQTTIPAHGVLHRSLSRTRFGAFVRDDCGSFPAAILS